MRLDELEARVAAIEEHLGIRAAEKGRLCDFDYSELISMLVFHMDSASVNELPLSDAITVVATESRPVLSRVEAAHRIQRTFERERFVRGKRTMTFVVKVLGHLEEAQIVIYPPKNAEAKP